MNLKNLNFKLSLSTTAIASTLALLTTLPAASVKAHHGFDGRYDASRPLYLEGTVRQTRWQAPHSVIEIELPKSLQIPENLGQLSEINNLGGQRIVQLLVVPKNLLGTTQRLELPPVGSMVRPLQNQLRPGERLSVIVYRNCEAPNQLRVQFARLQDGTTVVRPGTVQTEVNGCNSRR
jgi:hypothetical protein